MANDDESKCPGRDRQLFLVPEAHPNFPCESGAPGTDQFHSASSPVPLFGSARLNIIGPPNVSRALVLRAFQHPGPDSACMDSTHSCETHWRREPLWVLLRNGVTSLVWHNQVPRRGRAPPHMKGCPETPRTPDNIPDKLVEGDVIPTLGQ